MYCIKYSTLHIKMLYVYYTYSYGGRVQDGLEGSMS